MAGRGVAVIIPHLGLYGGNLRYLELGNALTDRGVDFTVATPDATRPDYLDYRGRVATLDELRADPPEVLLASEQRIFDESADLQTMRGTHCFHRFLDPRIDPSRKLDLRHFLSSSTLASNC